MFFINRSLYLSFILYSCFSFTQTNSDFSGNKPSSSGHGYIFEFNHGKIANCHNDKIPFSGFRNTGGYSIDTLGDGSLVLNTDGTQIGYNNFPIAFYDDNCDYTQLDLSNPADRKLKIKIISDVNVPEFGIGFSENYFDGSMIGATRTLENSFLLSTLKVGENILEFNPSDFEYSFFRNPEFDFSQMQTMLLYFRRSECDNKSEDPFCSHHLPSVSGHFKIEYIQIGDTVEMAQPTVDGNFKTSTNNGYAYMFTGEFNSNARFSRYPSKINSTHYQNKGTSDGYLAFSTDGTDHGTDSYFSFPLQEIDLSDLANQKVKIKICSDVKVPEMVCAFRCGYTHTDVADTLYQTFPLEIGENIIMFDQHTFTNFTGKKLDPSSIKSLQLWIRNSVTDDPLEGNLGVVGNFKIDYILIGDAISLVGDFETHREDCFNDKIIIEENIEDPIISGFQEKRVFTTLAFSPNPISAGSICFQYPLSGNLQVLNSVGEIVLTKRLVKQEKIDLSTLDRGFYFLIMKTRRGEYLSAKCFKE